MVVPHNEMRDRGSGSGPRLVVDRELRTSSGQRRPELSESPGRARSHVAADTIDE
jgi:hypothetical protein